MSNINNDDPGRIALLVAAHRALRTTCQLYQWVKDDSDRFIANGCVILFKYNASHYCFSNAHVLADRQLSKTFFLLKDGTSMTVGGDLFFSLPVLSQRREDDLLDIAIVKLNENVTEHLLKNGNEFLDLSQLRTIPHLSKGDRLLIAGYPASKTKIDLKNNCVEFNPLMVTTIPYLKRRTIKNFNKEFHHFAEFPINSFKEISTGQRMRAAKPHGISGSGLWLFTNGNDGYPAPILIGILSEYHENNAAVISTKIDFFIDLLRQRFDPSIQHDGIKVDLEYKN